MTKDELQKEAYEWTEKNISVGISMYNPSIEMYCGKAYKDGAEPREKQIEIDATHIRALQKQNGELTDKVNDLEEKLANADYQLEGRDNEIRELEAQIKKMKKYIKACWIEENLNDYSSYITNNSDEFRDLVKEINDEVRNGR